MRYSLLRIAKSYVREFNLFCEYVKIYSKDEKYSLLAYSLKPYMSWIAVNFVTQFICMEKLA